MLNDAVKTWMRQNCTDPDLPPSVSRTLDEASALSLDFAIVLGQRRVKNGRAHLLHGFSGELFSFTLFPRQVAAIGLEEDRIGVALGKSQRRSSRVEKPAISLDRISLSRPDELKNSEPITGCAWYHFTDPHPATYALCLSYSLPNLLERTGWHYIDQPLFAEGSFRFSYPPVADPGFPVTQTLRGPLVLFFRIVQVPDPHHADENQPVSNTRAILVDIAP